MLALPDARRSLRPDAAAVAVRRRTMAIWASSANAQLKAGETVFVNGGTGEVGSCVLQDRAGSQRHVFTTAGSREKVQICRQFRGRAGGKLKETDNMEAALGRFGPSTSGSKRCRSRFLTGRSSIWLSAGGPS